MSQELPFYPSLLCAGLQEPLPLCAQQKSWGRIPLSWGIGDKMSASSSLCLFIARDVRGQQESGFQIPAAGPVANSLPCRLWGAVPCPLPSQTFTNCHLSTPPPPFPQIGLPSEASWRNHLVLRWRQAGKCRTRCRLAFVEKGQPSLQRTLSSPRKMGMTETWLLLKFSSRYASLLSYN